MSPSVARSNVPPSNDLDYSTHFVQFYNNDRFIVERVARRAGAALRAGESCVLAATRFHLDDIDYVLSRRGIDTEYFRELGRYIELDAAQTLSEFMHLDSPNEGKFLSLLGGAIQRASALSPSTRVCAFGEMVALLCAAGNSGAALQLEKLWNKLGRSFNFSLCCAYPLAAFADDFDGSTLVAVCAQHVLALPAEAPF